MNRNLRSTPRTPSSRVPAALAVPAVAALLALGTLAGVSHIAFAGVPAAGLDRAIRAQRALVSERPAEARLQEDLGSLLSLDGDLEGAEAAYREALILDPASASAHFQLGSILERRGEDRAALKQYEATIELDPQHAWAEYESGTIWHRWGLDGKAKRAYARAFALDPTLADASVNPHVLENEHVTSAMILAYRKYRPEIAAPRTFHEPARIASLILEKPASGDRLAANPAAAARPAESYVAAEPVTLDSVSRGIGEVEEEEVTDLELEGESRVLTAKDLDPANSSGQVVGGAVAGGTSSRGSSAESAAERARARAAARQAARANRDPDAEGARGGSVVGPLPLNPGRGAGSGGYVPSPESTGRLEVRLEDSFG